MSKILKDKKEKQKGKSLIGTVISLKMQKTAIVEVEREKVHPLYKKILRRRKKYKVDTNSQEVKVGDLVKIIETKPISKGKYFKIFVLQDKKKTERKLNGSA